MVWFISYAISRDMLSSMDVGNYTRWEVFRTFCSDTKLYTSYRGWSIWYLCSNRKFTRFEFSNHSNTKFIERNPVLQDLQNKLRAGVPVLGSTTPLQQPAVCYLWMRRQRSPAVLGGCTRDIVAWGVWPCGDKVVPARRTFHRHILRCWKQGSCAR